MQPVQKKQRPAHRRRPLLLLICLVAALAGVLAAWLILRRAPVDVTPTVLTAGVYLQMPTGMVDTLTVRLDTGEEWQAHQLTDGILTVSATAEDTAFDMSASRSADLLGAAAIIAWEDILSEEESAYLPYLAEFGLEEPQAVVTVTYTDGSEVTFSIGAQSDAALEEVFYYMRIEGDERLFTLAKGTAENLMLERAVLRPVSQPVIHKARLSEITLTVGRSGWQRLSRLCHQRMNVRSQSETMRWVLDGSITDADAADRWLLTAPLTYPADGDALDSLRANLANLRLGAWECAATPENLRRYGFTHPRLIITLGQQAGNTLSADGESLVSWPESTLALTVGGMRNEYVDYILYEGGIYRVSHFTIQVFESIQPADTLTRYPVLTSLSNLEALTVTSDGEAVTWKVTRSLMEEGDAYDYTATRNGEEADWNSFDSVYSNMLLVTASGKLPSGWSPEGEPRVTLTFSSRTGAVHELALYSFDALHDALCLDGVAVFYLIRGGLIWPE